MANRPELGGRFTLAGSGDRAAVIAARPWPANLTLSLVGEVLYRDLPVGSWLTMRWCSNALRHLGHGGQRSHGHGAPGAGSELSQAVCEMIRDGQNGWRYDPRDPARTRAALDQLLTSNRRTTTTPGRAARDTALSLAPEPVAEMIIESCRRAMAGR
ncbi:MAG: hypothetical protein R3E83_11260 [Burkholderiaceae bacterium]